MPAPHRVDRLGVREPEAFGDLGRSDEILHVDLPSHAVTELRRTATTKSGLDYGCSGGYNMTTAVVNGP